MPYKWNNHELNNFKLKEVLKKISMNKINYLIKLLNKNNIFNCKNNNCNWKNFISLKKSNIFNYSNNNCN